MAKFSRAYKAYLRSDAWKIRRKQVIVPGSACVKCGSRRQLQLDHLAYPAWGADIQAFIDQPNHQFRILCAQCHKQSTRVARAKRRKVK